MHAGDAINDKSRLHPKFSGASDGKASIHAYDNASRIRDEDDEQLANIQSHPYDRVDYKRKRWKTTNNNDENYNHLAFTKGANQFEIVQNTADKTVKPIPAKRAVKHGDNTMTLPPVVAPESVGVNQSERTQLSNEIDMVNMKEHGANTTRGHMPHVMGTETVMVENSDVYETLA